MKMLLATAFLLAASSLVTAQAEWEILDLPTPVSTQVASTAPVQSTTSTAPTQSQAVTK